MEDYRSLALTQAAELIAQAAGEPIAQRCRMRGDWCASAAVFALGSPAGAGAGTGGGGAGAKGGAKP